MIRRTLQWAQFAAGSFLGRIVARLVKDAQPRIIYGADGIDPYLSRYYLLRGPWMPNGSSPFDTLGNPKPGSVWPKRSFGLHLHRFHRSDQDQELHSHPWYWALSFVISGGYREERRCGDRVISRIVPPLSFNFIHSDDYHRVDLLAPEAWTFFLTGPRKTSWNFWNRTTGVATPWRTFIAQREKEQS